MAGRTELATDLDASWAFLLQEMVATLGKEEAFRSLARFAVHARGRHFNLGGLALQSFSWSAAKLALRPSYLPPEFDWDQWVRIATLIKDNDIEAQQNLSQAELAIALELQTALGDFAAALRLAQGLDARHEVRVVRDLMWRMDYRRKARSDFPAGNMSNGLSILYRFPPGLAVVR